MSTPQIIQMSDPTETGHLYALRKKYGNLLEDVLTDARLCLLREFSDFGYNELATSIWLQYVLKFYLHLPKPTWKFQPAHSA
jgi:hypothetical protein